MTTEHMPAFIEEANELYLTDPAGAVAVLYEGTRELREKVSRKRQPGSEKRARQAIIYSGVGSWFDGILAGRCGRGNLSRPS